MWTPPDHKTDALRHPELVAAQIRPPRPVIVEEIGLATCR